MTGQPKALRRRSWGRTGVAAATVGVGVAVSWEGGEPAAAASAGAVEVVAPSSGGGALTAGGSRTSFGLKLPVGAACTGDSANAGYRIQSFLVPESVDLDTLRFNAGEGPVPVEGEIRQPLFSVTQSPLVDNQTATAVAAGGPGPIIQPLDAFNLAVFPPGFLSAGAYRIGIACTLGPPTSPTQLDRYWHTSMTIAADSGDEPAQARWTVTAPAAIRTRSSFGWMTVATGAAAFATGGVLVLRRRKTSSVATSDPSPPDSAKETR